ncbi:hypothetical protein KR032_008915, partial [Drosophila birchii]
MHSQMEQKELQCRICLLQPKDESLMPTETDFCNQIQRCTGIQLKENANVPNLICTSCALLLRAALKLRSLCQDAEKALQQQRIQIDIKENVPRLENESKDLPSKEASCSDSDEVEYEYLEPYSLVALESDLEAAGSADEIISIEHLTSTPTSLLKEESVEPMSPALDPDEDVSHDQAPSLSCKVCHKTYTDRIKLAAHQKVHDKEKPHECEICHKRFRQTPQLTRHMNTHTRNRPYKCDYCDSCFADPSTRIKHHRIHTHERPYKCKHCSKSFAYSNVLRVHIKTHTGERPFSCQHCQRTFSQLHHKNAHEKSHKSKDHR